MDGIPHVRVILNEDGTAHHGEDCYCAADADHDGDEWD